MLTAALNTDARTCASVSSAGNSDCSACSTVVYGRIAAVVLQLGEPRVVLERRDEPLLRPSWSWSFWLATSALSTSANAFWIESWVVVERGLLPAFGLRDLAADRAEREDRPDDLPGVAPDARGPGEQIRQVGARAAERAGQRDRREVERLGRADLRVGGDQRLLGLQQVRPPLEQLPTARRPAPSGSARS